MSKETNVIPKIAIQSIGAALVLMAFFTLMWNSIAEIGFNGSGWFFRADSRAMHCGRKFQDGS